MAQKNEHDKEVPATRIEIVKPQWLVDEVEQRFPKKHFGAWFVDKLLPLLITVGVAIGGYLVNAKVERDSMRQTVEKESLESEIAQKKSLSDSNSVAFTNFRATRQKIVMNCQHDTRYAKDSNLIFEANMRRFEARVALINAGAGYDFTFGQNVQDMMTAFTKWDEEIENVCAKNAPQDEEYRQKQIEIENAMKQSIQESEQKLIDEFER